MRTYGRTKNEQGKLTWVEVTTDINGLNDEVYITTLAQVLQLVRGESPFYANYGIPSIQAVQTDLIPDFYTAQTQQQFAPFFASLIIYRLNTVTPPGQIPVPTYQVNIVTNQGAVLPAITIPTSIPT